MKTFKEYLTESKKVYGFKIKVAGEVPENFQENLKNRVARCGIVTFEKIKTTPIQEAPLDFPEARNSEVTVFDFVCEYPITSPEISQEILEMGVEASKFKVRNSLEPTEVDQELMDAEPREGALLDDETYAESPNIEHKDYFGDEFNKGFLADLAKAAQERKKELGHNNNDSNVLEATAEEGETGKESPVGSK